MTLHRLPLLWRVKSLTRIGGYNTPQYYQHIMTLPCHRLPPPPFASPPPIQHYSSSSSSSSSVQTKRKRKATGKGRKKSVSLVDSMSQHLFGDPDTTNNASSSSSATSSATQDSKTKSRNKRKKQQQQQRGHVTEKNVGPLYDEETGVLQKEVTLSDGSKLYNDVLSTVKIKDRKGHRKYRKVDARTDLASPSLSPSSSSLSNLALMERASKSKKQFLLRVSIIGIPNAGKSTLLNRVVGEKVSAVSPKRQTTRRNVVGVKTHPQYRTQIVFYDTPGLLNPADTARISDADETLNARALSSISFATQGTQPDDDSSRLEELTTTMIQQSLQGANLVDVVVVLLDVNKDLTKQVNHLIGSLEGFLDRLGVFDTAIGQKLRMVAVLNKIDMLPQPRAGRIAEMKHELMSSGLFSSVFAISGMKGEGVETFMKHLYEDCVDTSEKRKWEFDPYIATDMTLEDRFNEIVREKLFRRLNAEVPYQVSVNMLKFNKRIEDRKARVTVRNYGAPVDTGKEAIEMVEVHMYHVEQSITVRTVGQKKIVISALSHVHPRAKEDMQRLLKKMLYEERERKLLIDSKYVDAIVNLVFQVHCETEDSSQAHTKK